MQMEPMALGSPPSSPSSPQANPNFLPAFLMGEQQVQTPNRPTNLSPTKNRSFGYKTPTSGNEQRTLHNRIFNMVPQEQTPFNLSNVGAEKTGPPALGLFDTLETTELTNSTKIDPSTSFREPFDIRSPILEKSFNASHSAYQRNLNDSLSKTHPFRKADKSESLWITVLGFPPHAANLVLTQFSQFGTIIDKKFPPEGNWVNLKYSSPHEVSRAMSFNGKIISNSIMVGVISHQKNTITSPQWENKENTDDIPVQVAMLTSPNRARSLTQPYVLPRNTEVLSPQNVPQRSTGLVTKAMEYVFGW